MFDQLCGILMPKLGEYQYLLDVVFFLYPDRASAEAGKDSGGTGFFVTIPSATHPDYHHPYAVTNWHVAVGSPKSQPCPVVRVNAKSNKSRIFEHDPSEWHFRGGWHDIAVLPISLDPRTLKVEAINAQNFFLTEADVSGLEINAGEDAFMLGRFIDFDGVEENCPSMRFGNISMMAARQRQQTGFEGQSIVVDMHSRTGYSGSPVFVYRTAGSIFAKPNTIVGGGQLMKLLGVLWGQFPEDWDIQLKGSASPSTVPMLDGHSIKGMSGMSLVCPAWAIWELLNMPELKSRRATIDAELHSGSLPQA
jgi:Trypsin-like peptidase domain